MLHFCSTKSVQTFVEHVPLAEWMAVWYNMHSVHRDCEISDVCFARGLKSNSAAYHIELVAIFKHSSSFRVRAFPGARQIDSVYASEMGMHAGSGHGFYLVYAYCDILWPFCKEYKCTMQQLC